MSASREVRQETCHNSSLTTTTNITTTVSHPQLVRTCTNLPVRVPRLTCREVSTERCLVVPRVSPS